MGPTSKGRGGDEKGREGKGKREEGRDPQWSRVHGARGQYFQGENIFCLKAFCTGFGVGYVCNARSIAFYKISVLEIKNLGMQRDF